MLKRSLLTKKKRFDVAFKDQRGATAIEYGLIAGLVAIALVAVLRLTGASLVAIFTSIERTVRSAAGG